MADEPVTFIHSDWRQHREFIQERRVFMSSSKPVYRIAYLVSHPIQYHTPMLKYLAELELFELKVFFCSTMGSDDYYDPEFGQRIKWNIPLLEGYDSEFLPAIGSNQTASSFSPLNYGLWRRLKKDQFDVLWVHGYARLFNLIAILIAKVKGIKVFIRDDSTLESRKRSKAKHVLKRFFFKCLSLACDRYLATGSRNAEYFAHYGIPLEKIHTLPYAVDNSYFQTSAQQAQASKESIRGELKLDPKRPIVIFVGKLVELKRPQDLIQAYKLLQQKNSVCSNMYILFIGNGPLRKNLEQEANGLDPESIRFLGFKDQTEIPNFYNLCDALVLPSAFETWGLVVNEVMNFKKPVIVSNKVGCSPELVQDGVNGWLFNPGDIKELANALENTLKNRATADKMGQQSFELINRFNYKNLSEQLYQLLN